MIVLQASCDQSWLYLFNTKCLAASSLVVDLILLSYHLCIWLCVFVRQIKQSKRSHIQPICDKQKHYVLKSPCLKNEAFRKELIVENRSQGWYRREQGAVEDSVIGIFVLSLVLCSLKGEEMEAQCDHGPLTG